MKLSKITYRHSPSVGNWNLIIESISDLKKFVAIDHKNNSESAWNLWSRLKEYKAADAAMDAYHAAQGELGIARLMAYKLENPKSDNRTTSIVEYCSTVDEFMTGKYLNMQKMLESGKKVRTNHKGGYSQFDDFFISLEDLECTDDMLIQYLFTGEVGIVELKFDKQVLVLENNEELSPYIYKCLNKYDYNSYQIIKRFRVRMMNKTASDIYKLFDDAIKLKLKTIYVETTLQDKVQFEQIKSILESVMKNNPDKRLSINLNIMGYDNIKIQTEIKNIKLNVTHNKRYDRN